MKKEKKKSDFGQQSRKGWQSVLCENQNYKDQLHLDQLVRSQTLNSQERSFPIEVEQE